MQPPRAHAGLATKAGVTIDASIPIVGVGSQRAKKGVTARVAGTLTRRILDAYTRRVEYLTATCSTRRAEIHKLTNQRKILSNLEAKTIRNYYFKLSNDNK